MSFKLKLFLFVFGLILGVSLIILWFNTEKKQYQPGISEKDDQAVNQSQLLYREFIKTSPDISSGPCLTNALMPGWVVDLVHSPRQPIDDLEENQCKSFVEGRSEHFVELDLSGNVVRVH